MLLNQHDNFSLKFWFFWLSIWWMTTQLAAFDNPCLCWRKECSCQWSLFYKLCNSFPLLFLLSFKYFSTHKKNVYEQTTFYGVSVFSEMILWTKETFSFILNQIFNTEFSILDVRFENWEISLAYPPVLARGYSVMWYV